MALRTSYKIHLKQIVAFFVIISLVLTVFSAFQLTAISKPGDTIDITPKIAVIDITKRNNATSPDMGNYNSVVSVLKTIGVPYYITTNITTALNEKIVIINDQIKTKSFTDSERGKIENYTKNGGIIVAFYVIPDAYNSLMGMNYKNSTNTRHSITFNLTKNDVVFRYINQDEEKTISLGKAKYTTTFYTANYEKLNATILGTFEDGKPAFAVNYLGKGKFYTSAVQWKDAILRGEINTDFDAQRSYSNSFEPSKDVFLLMIKALYENLDFALLKYTVLDGKETALILTHDVDTNISFKNSIEFMNLEKNYSVKSTFFITTKYFIDARDMKDFYNTNNIQYLKTLKQNGYDVQSHTVGHFEDFNTFPLGSPNITKSTYTPYNNGTKTTGGTIYGEVKVSKQLLDSDLSQNTISFRAGHLSFPSQLGTALENSGYSFDSSFSANDVLTNYPYYLMKNLSTKSSPTNVIEIPMTLSDSKKSMKLNETNVDYIVNELWIKTAEKNRENNAITTLLIHPSYTTYKISAETKMLNFVKDKEYWVGDFTTFGKFWKQRNDLSYTSSISSGKLTIRLNLNSNELIQGMTLEIIDGKNSFSDITIKSKDGKDITFKKIIQYDNFGKKIFVVLKVSSNYLEVRNYSANDVVEKGVVVSAGQRKLIRIV